MKEELHQVIEWLTGYDELRLQDLIDKKATFETFFQNAELFPTNAHLIKGVICGYRIEEIDNRLTQQVRFLDKLVDELAKGRKLLWKNIKKSHLSSISHRHTSKNFLVSVK